MKKMIQLVSFLAVFGLASQASAGFLIEPYLGYQSSEFKSTDATTNVSGSDKTTGMGMGLRAGYKSPVMVWVALDYFMLSGATVKGENNYSGKLDASDLYLDVGVDLPILLRAWVGYGLQNTSTSKPDTGPSAKGTYESATKLGVGFTALPFVSLNVEYFMSKLKEVEGNNVSSALSKRDNTGVIISASIPFNF